MTPNVTAPLSPFASLPSYLPPSLRPFLTLSYPVPAKSPSPSLAFTSRHASHALSHTTAQPTLYGKGRLDACIVVSAAIAFTLLREMFIIATERTMQWYLAGAIRKDRQRTPSPSGKGSGRERLSKRERRKVARTATRFAEQGWSFLYCTVSWSLGMLILSRIPSPTSPEQLWGTYPVLHLPPVTKFYYLAQLGWWFHQLYVINSEKPRSDHWQMLGHHILSIVLIVTSYIANFTRVGTLIHVLMDFCDILLPLAKMLRYLSFTTACDAAFVVFLVSWLVTRQLGLFFVIRTTIFDLPKSIPYAWNPSAGLYCTRATHMGFLVMQVILYCLASVWFVLACRVAIRVVRGLGAEDVRSDDEDGEEGEDGVDSPLEDVPESVSAGRHNEHRLLSGSGKGLTNGHAAGPDGNGDGDGEGELRKRK